PPLQSARRLPLPQPLRRRVVAVDTVVVDTAADTAGWGGVGGWAGLGGRGAPPWGGGLAGGGLGGAGCRWGGAAGGAGVARPGRQVATLPPRFSQFCLLRRPRLRLQRLLQRL